MSRLPQLLSPVTLGTLRLPNRVLMAPMARHRADADGCMPAYAADYFEQRSSIGLLITDGTMVSPQAVGYRNTPGLWTEAQAEAWRTVVDAVHAVGGLIAVQLMHCGRVSLTSLQPGGGAPVAASEIPAGTHLLSPQGVLEAASEPRALDTTEMRDIVSQFTDAARRARAIGFDAIELHAGDGYLIDQFLRDSTNTRFDRYGGSAEHRARLLLEVTEGIAGIFGADRTGVRITPESAMHDMSDRDPVTTFGSALRQLAALDLAWVQMGGSGTSSLTHRLRDAYGKPFVVNGGLDGDRANDAIRSELAIAVSFGRACIANPDLVERFEIGAPLATPDPATFYTGGERGYIDYPTVSDGG
jgi:N-ethylmaleimide reductase